MVVAPTFVGLYEAVKAAAGTGIGIAAQDVFWEAEGAYTGEVSPRTLAALGVAAAIIGHSERRQHFAETDNWVAMKMRAALDHGLLPIMCVGETGQERGAGLTEEILSTQVPVGLTSVRGEELGSVAIAYEPIWAIGTGKTATPEMAQEAAAFIREQVGVAFGAEAARKRAGALRRKRQGRQYRRPHGETGHRRRPGGRSQPGGGVVQSYSPLPRGVGR